MSNWISVAIDMPFQFDNVLVWTGVAVLMAYWNPGDESFILAFGGTKVNATHWRRLPDPPCAPSAPADEDKKPLIEPGCGVEGDGEIGFNTLTGNYGIVPPCGPFAAPSPQVPEKKGDKG